MGRRLTWSRFMLPSARTPGVSGYNAKIARNIYHWNNRPRWPYIGQPRMVSGRELDPRNFSIANQFRTRDQKLSPVSFSRTKSPVATVWSVHDQAWAVGQGFFFQRDIVQERVVIVGISKFPGDIFDYADPVGAYTEIERRCFQCRPGYERALRFIQQQDEFGWTGAWGSPSIMDFSPRLLWYKMYCQTYYGGKRPPDDLKAHGDHAKVKVKRTMGSKPELRYPPSPAAAYTQKGQAHRYTSADPAAHLRENVAKARAVKASYRARRAIEGETK